MHPPAHYRRDPSERQPMLGIVANACLGGGSDAGPLAGKDRASAGAEVACRGMGSRKDWVPSLGASFTLGRPHTIRLKILVS